MSALPADSKIAKLLRLLGSDKPGEVVAAAAAIGRALKSNGRDWHDLARACARPEAGAPLRSVRPAPTSFGDIARFCRDHDRGRLSDAERQFVLDMVGRGFHRAASSKQMAWLEAIFVRLRREAA
jgi:hypothetical protein